MTSDNHYPNAPITEAIIDIQVNVPVSVEALENANVGELDYPSADKLNTTMGAMIVGPDHKPAATVTSQQTGYLYRSVDGLHIYQARTNGFTLSRLAPYPHWGVFSAEARRLWEKFKGVAKPSAITRVAVRYVNRIDIPLPLDNFDDYLRTTPQLSPDLPQGLSGYFMQLMFPLPAIKGNGIINEAIIDPAKPGVVSVVLDIDVFRTIELPQSEGALWDLLEALRRAKNDVFEACITDEARRLFQ
jgi:uncharacterized protein (TIGR04255 family)